VHEVNIEEKIFQIRKEDISITLLQQGNKIELNSVKENSHLVSLLVMEEILELKDLLEGIKQLDSPEGLCSELASDLFCGEEEKKDNT